MVIIVIEPYVRVKASCCSFRTR